MEGHTAVVESLLAASPEIPKAVDIEGMRALDYAKERGWAATVAALSYEDHLRRKLRVKWREHFEPPCRALLNTPACNAFLEIGRPQVLGIEHALLRLTCRVVDALGLVRGYDVEICAGSAGSTTVRFARSSSQRTMDDVELVLPRRKCPEAIWELTPKCRIRVVGLVDERKAAEAGVEGRHVCSPVP